MRETQALKPSASAYGVESNTALEEVVVQAGSQPWGVRRFRFRFGQAHAQVRGPGFRLSLRSAGMTACSLSRSDDLDLQQPFLIEKSADDHRDRGFARAHDLIADGAVLDRVLAV